jgi:hypothetical protein
MQFSRLNSVALAAAAAAVLAPAVTALRVEIGTNEVNGHTNNIAWETGQQCGNVTVLSQHPANPCRVRFDAGGYEGLTFEGCGSEPLWLNHKGNWLVGCQKRELEYDCSDGRKFKQQYYCL